MSIPRRVIVSLGVLAFLVVSAGTASATPDGTINGDSVVASNQWPSAPVNNQWP